MKKPACSLLLAAALLVLTSCGNPGLGALASRPDEEEDRTPAVSTPAVDEPADDGDAAPGYPDQDGYAEGHIGDTMHTYFFDYTVNSAHLSSNYGGSSPAEGCTFLVVDITVENTTNQSYDMYDTDFQAQWGSDGADDYRVPITTDMETGQELSPLTDEQLPGTYLLGIGEKREGLLVYEVPLGYRDFSISYMEYFDDDSTGDLFFVYFTVAQAETGLTQT